MKPLKVGRYKSKLALRAYQLGVDDARLGRLYRDSAEIRSWVRQWLEEYDKGWKSIMG